MELFTLLKFTILMQRLFAEFQKWLIQRQEEERQAAITAACDVYKEAKTQDDRLNAARGLQAATRKPATKA